MDGKCRNMHGTCMEYVLNMYGICMEYVWIMHGICMENVWNKHGICMEYVWNMYMEYAWNMYGIRMRYVICREREREREGTCVCIDYLEYVRHVWDLYGTPTGSPNRCRRTASRDPTHEILGDPCPDAAVQIVWFYQADYSGPFLFRNRVIQNGGSRNSEIA
jgi:hypothetical protein